MPRSPRPMFRAGLAVVVTALLGALPVVTPRPPLAEATSVPISRSPGYWLAGGDGSIYPFGSAADRGSLRGKPLSHPVVGMTPTPSGAGYWMVASDGGIFSFGDAAFHGSTGNVKLAQPIVGMAATPTGRGYWFVAADGGIFSFGDAAFYGSTGAIKLNKPIVGMAPTPSGKGYWFVASDGGIFSFGDAAFYGSTGAMKLSRPIVGMAASPTGNGYWFVASDGGIFNFGDASFLGSAGGTALPAGIVVMAGGLLPPPGTTPTDPTTATTGPGSTGTTVTTVPSGPPPTGQPFDIGLIGDTNYTAADETRFEKVLTQMNRSQLAFVVHDGDIKSPTSACDEAVFNWVKDKFNRSTAPFVYAVGDNEWMDCNNADNAAPIDNLVALDEVREVFYPNDASLGANPMPLTTQRVWDTGLAPKPQQPHSYPENARWTKEGVVFATLNAPGPSDDINNKDESDNRRTANLDWLNKTFDQAVSTNAPAVMMIWQADPWYVSPTGIDFSRTWAYLMDALKQRTIAFGKPVVLVHGDTHIFRIDKGGWPDGTGGMKGAFDDVPNFTRVETHGLNSDAVRWVKATVDPSDPKVFSFKSMDAS